MQDKCVGMRIYYATNDEGVKQLLLVDAREDGSNIWPDSDKGEETAASRLIVNASHYLPSVLSLEIALLSVE